MSRPPTHKYRRWSSVCERDFKAILPLARSIARARSECLPAVRQRAILATSNFSSYQILENQKRFRTNIEGMELRSLDTQLAMATCLKVVPISDYKAVATAVARIGYFLHWLPKGVACMTPSDEMTPLEYWGSNSQITWEHFLAISSVIEIDVPRVPIDPIYSVTQFLLKSGEDDCFSLSRPDGFYDFVHSIEDLKEVCRINSAICSACFQYAVSKELTPRQLRLRAAAIACEVAF